MDKLPSQPIKNNRFVPNKIVRYLLDSNPIVDLNKLSEVEYLFSREEWMQFYQLIGYPLIGYAEIFGGENENNN